MNTANIITLTTDFGLTDPYVGQVKGAILQRNIKTRIIDLNHSIPAHDIFTGAICIAASYKHFPPGTVHLGIIDPGVGSQRSIIAATDGQYLFVVPDNGLLTIVNRNNCLKDVYRLENISLYPPEVSSTFHGRDIMSPVAAALASGMDISEIGTRVDFNDCIQLEISKPIIHADIITGEVLYIDGFGNIKTNITYNYLSEFQPSSFKKISIGEHDIKMILTTYAEQEQGKLVGLVDSSGYVEIAVNKGNAAKFTGCGRGDMVTIFFTES